MIKADVPMCGAAVEEFLGGCGFGSEMPRLFAPWSARLRSFSCNEIQKPGSKVRLIMRSP